jgi:DNA repair exonuclease SbcCD ATPase subunit
MPRESFWTGFLKVALPTILAAALGSGITFYGLKQTNKHHAAENAANRQHELEKLNREHSFALKRDVLIRLTQSLVQTIAALREWDISRDYLAQLRVNGEEPNAEMRRVSEEISKAWTEYWLRRSELEQAIAAARLAVSDELWKSAQAAGACIEQVQELTTNGEPPCYDIADYQIEVFTKAARKELGVVNIDA